jgi:tetratricopeptide (TPR) repeat protein
MPAELNECLAEITRLLRLMADEKARAAGAAPTLTDRLESALKIITKAGLAALLAGAAAVLTVMTIEAWRSHSVVVDEFTVPKSLADNGLTGRSAAAKVVDALFRAERDTRLAVFQQSLESGRYRPVLESSAADDVNFKLAVADTSISFNDLQLFLHRVLSSDIHISGFLEVLPDKSMRLNIRGDGIPIKSIASNTADFDDIATKAAEHVYGEIDPVPFATFLLQHLRTADGLQFVASRFAWTAGTLRPALATIWATLEAYSGDFARAVELDRLALSLDKYYWPAWEEMAQDERLLEGPEAEVRAFRTMHKAARQAPPEHRPRMIDFRLEYNLLHDQPGEICALLQDRQSIASGTEGTAAWFGLAMAELGRHGLEAARRYMAEADPDDPLLENHMHEVRAGLYAPDNPDQTIREQEAAFNVNKASDAETNMIPDGACGLAIAYARVGREKEARAMLALAEKRNAHVGCGGNKGVALDWLGDTQAAAQAFEAAIKDEPSLPEPYEQRGEVRFRHHDLLGAAGDFANAVERAPNWADPLKWWGDILALQGKKQQALEKYGKALALAPEWKELITARTALGAAPPAATPHSEICSATQSL